MSCCGETGIDRRLHPCKTVPDGAVRLDVMQQLDGFFFKDTVCLDRLLRSYRR